MTEIPAAAREYLDELLKRRKAYTPDLVNDLQTRFKRKDRKPPEVFHESSYLLIRSYDGDDGTRPFSNIVFWRSPDLTLSPLTNLGTAVTEIQAGDTYLVRTLLRNRGDLPVPAAKVELFLVDPSIGFSVQFATRLTGLGTVAQAYVPALGAAAAEFTWAVPSTLSGHKCLFARVFSFSPLDLPIDDNALDPTIDRHVAQQNLNILAQAQAFTFNLVHRANARVTLAVRPLDAIELMAIRHPGLAGIKPFPDVPRGGWGRRTGLRLEEGAGDVSVEETADGLNLKIDGDGISLNEQKSLWGEMRDVLGAIGAGKTKASQHKDLFGQYRKMTKEARQSRFSIKTPQMNLAAGQAMGFDIVGTDQAGGGVIGGITLVMIG